MLLGEYEGYEWMITKIIDYISLQGRNGIDLNELWMFISKIEYEWINLKKEIWCQLKTLKSILIFQINEKEINVNEDYSTLEKQNIRIIARESYRLAALGMFSRGYIGSDAAFDVLEQIAKSTNRGLNMNELKQAMNQSKVYGKDAKGNLKNLPYLVDILVELGLVHKQVEKIKGNTTNRMFLRRYRLPDGMEMSTTYTKIYNEIVDLLRTTKEKLGVDTLVIRDVWEILNLRDTYNIKKPNQIQNLLSIRWSHGKSLVELVQCNAQRLRTRGVDPVHDNTQVMWCCKLLDSHNTKADTVEDDAADTDGPAVYNVLTGSNASGLVYELSIRDQCKIHVLSRGQTGLSLPELSTLTNVKSKTLGRLFEKWQNGDDNIQVQKSLSKYNQVNVATGDRAAIEKFQSVYPHMVLEQQLQSKDRQKYAKRMEIVYELVRNKRAVNILEIMRTIRRYEAPLNEGTMDRATLVRMLEKLVTEGEIELQYFKLEDQESTACVIFLKGQVSDQEIHQAIDFKVTVHQDATGVSGGDGLDNVMRIHDKDHLTALIHEVESGRDMKELNYNSGAVVENTLGTHSKSDFEIRVSEKGFGELVQRDLISKMCTEKDPFAMSNAFYNSVHLMERVQIFHSWLLVYTTLFNDGRDQIPLEMGDVLGKMPLSVFLKLFNSSPSNHSINHWTPELCTSILQGAINGDTAQGIPQIAARAKLVRRYTSILKLLGALEQETISMQSNDVVSVRFKLFFNFQSPETDEVASHVQTLEQADRYYEWLLYKAIQKRKQQGSRNTWFSAKSWPRREDHKRTVDTDKTSKKRVKEEHVVGEKRKHENLSKKSRKKTKSNSKAVTWSKENESFLLRSYVLSHNVKTSRDVANRRASLAQCFAKLDSMIRSAVNAKAKTTERIYSPSTIVMAMLNKVVLIQICKSDKEVTESELSKLAPSIFHGFSLENLQAVQQIAVSLFANCEINTSLPEIGDIVFTWKPSRLFTNCLRRVEQSHAPPTLRLKCEKNIVEESLDLNALTGEHLLCTLRQLTDSSISIKCEVGTMPQLEADEASKSDRTEKAPPKISVSTVSQHEPLHDISFQKNNAPVLQTPRQESSKRVAPNQTNAAIASIKKSEFHGTNEDSFEADLLQSILKNANVYRVPCYDHYRLVYSGFEKPWMMTNVADGKQVVARKWMSLDGSMNAELFEAIKQRIVVYVFDNPGVSKQALYEVFGPVFDPVDVDDLVQLVAEDGQIRVREYMGNETVEPVM